MTSARRLFAVILCGLAGCSDPDPGRPPVHPVEGRLLVAGVPAGNARVAFHPPTGPVSVGVTDEDGTFHLMTYTTGDGAPAGEYVVTVLWLDYSLLIDDCGCSDPTLHDRLRGQYADAAKSPLRATVRPERNTLTVNATVGAMGWNLPREHGAGATKDRPASGRSSTAGPSRATSD